MKQIGAKWIGAVGAVLLSMIVLMALIGPYVVPYDGSERSGMPFEPPSTKHWLGTNDMGQDIMAELVEGARTSLLIGIAAAVLATIIGTVIGLLAGYAGGWVDSLLMRLVDVSLTLPFLPLMIVIAVYIGPSLTTQILVITLVMWAGKARKIRAQTLSLRSRGQVLAAKSMGAGHTYLLTRHIFPNVVPLVIPQFVQAVNASIMMESSLSFLGMGDPLSKSWGSILFYANNRSAFLTEAWSWWVVPPGICIIITVLGFSFIGYYLEERSNPRLRVARDSAKHNVMSGTTSAAVAGFKPSKAILEVKNLVVSYPKKSGLVPAVNKVSFSVGKGEVVGLVGESGSGKTTVAGAIMQLLKSPATLQGGSICFNGRDLTQMTEEEIQELRGHKIALIPQAAMNALNPVMTIREQLAEAILTHRKMEKEQVQARIDEVLMQVGSDRRWGDAYSHELSGGMRQRVVIAMALINEPELVIADEPTTGLDVIVQVEIISLLKDLQKRLGLSMIFISHDLPVVIKLSDWIVILDQGKVVDSGDTHTLTKVSTQPYTRRLIDSIPRLVGQPSGSPRLLQEQS